MPDIVATLREIIAAGRGPYGGPPSSWDIVEEAANEIERLQYYPRVIADLNKGLYANRRVCEIIERLVTEAVEESKVSNG